MTLKRTRHLDVYTTIKELVEEHPEYPASRLCKLGHITRASYYKWKSRSDNENVVLNERIAAKVEQIHEEHPDMGYRRIRDTLEHDYDICVNDKRVLRICRKKKIRSMIKHRYNCCTKPASNPAYVAENILNREFHADKLNEKWVTDISEFKYGTDEDTRKGKVYLSVILDLCDKRPVAYVYSDHNDNSLVLTTFNKAIERAPGATPIFHSDRGYQYTSKEFRQKIVNAGMTQSMSRVAHCIDNGPMEGFWGIMKREMYYGHQFRTKEDLLLAIEEYMTYYTTKRVQRKLNVMTPIEYHEMIWKHEKCPAERPGRKRFLLFQLST